MTNISISPEAAKSIQAGIYQKSEIAYAIEAISRLLKANSEGSVPNFNEMRTGMHCALDILSGLLREVSSRDIDFVDDLE